MKSVTGHRKEIWGWAFYDFANSAYATSVVAVIFSVYFAKHVVGPDGISLLGILIPGDAAWGLSVSLSMLLVFLTAPVLGAIADFSASKKRFLFYFCYSGVLTTVLLYWVGPGDVWLGVFVFVLSNAALESSFAMYNAFLPEIASREEMGRVSGFGWALGYVGSTLSLLVSLAVIGKPEWFSLSTENFLPVRTSMIMVAVWWGLFAIPTFLWLKERALRQKLPPGGSYIQVGFQRLFLTFRKVKNYRELGKFLLAFLIYNDGIQTVIVMASVFGSRVLNMPQQELILCLLLNQSVAIIGALGFGYLADRLPTKRVIHITLLVWSISLIFAVGINQSWHFWVLSAVIGLVLGGSQAASRTLFAQFTPPQNSAEFFAFFAISGKFAALLGPAFFALVSTFVGIRYAIASLLVFFLVGATLLKWVDEALGKQQGQRAVEDPAE